MLYYDVLNELEIRHFIRISEKNKNAGQICGYQVHFFDCENGVEYAASPEAVWRCSDDTKCQYQAVLWTDGSESVVSEKMLNVFISAMKVSSESIISESIIID